MRYEKGDGYITEPYTDKKGLYFGVELEVAALRNDEVADIVAGACDFDQDEDGSIRHCDWPLELQSHPATWLWWTQNRNRINKLVRSLRRAGCHSDSLFYNCGMHVHFSRVLSDEHIINVMQMIYLHPQQCALFSCRTTKELNIWARVTLDRQYNYWSGCSCEDCVAAKKARENKLVGTSVRTQVKEFVHSNYKYEKMFAIHYSQYYPTVEIRLFSGTLNCRQFWANLEFCRALIEYTGLPGFNPDTMCNWDMFHYWIHKQPKMASLKWAMNRIVVKQ